MDSVTGSNTLMYQTVRIQRKGETITKHREPACMRNNNWEAPIRLNSLSFMREALVLICYRPTHRNIFLLVFFLLLEDIYEENEGLMCISEYLFILIGVNQEYLCRICDSNDFDFYSEVNSK